MWRTICIFLVSFFSLCTASLADESSTDKKNSYQIIIEEIHQKCGEDSDCTAVITACNQCQCYGEPVNREYVSFYQDRLKSLCKDYHGPQCMMLCGKATFECVAGLCKLNIAPPDISAPGQ